MKLTKILSLVLVCAIMTLALVSCGKPSGTYEIDGNIKISLTFEGDTVTGKIGDILSLDVGTTYEIKDGDIIFTIPSKNDKVVTLTYAFDKKGDTITLTSKSGVPTVYTLTKVK